MRHVFIVLALTALPLGAQTADPRVISVSGEAVVMVVPNQAVVTIGVETFEPTLSVASQKNDQAARAMIAEWKQLNVTDANIKTDGVSVTVAYSSRSDYARKVEGFVVTRSYEVTVDSASLAEKVIARGLESGANRIGGIDFRTTEMRKHRDQARVNAVKAAHEKAVLMATQLGASVGPPRNISESASYYRYSGYRNANSMSQNSMSAASDGGDPDSSGAVAPGQVAVRANVAVVFDLIPKQ